MSPATDAKRRIGARVHAKAHFAMSESDAKRTFGSAWNTHLVSGTVESVHEGDAGKRVSMSVAVMWDLPAGRKLRSVNIRSVASGDASRTTRAVDQQPPPASGCAADTGAEQDGGSQHQASAAYSASGSALLPDTADNLADATAWTAHGVLWEEENVLEPVGGDVPRRVWTLQTAVGDTIVEGGDSGSAIPPRRPYDYFMAVFPPDQLVRMVELTNKKLTTIKKPQLTTGELLKFLGVLILGTRYEFGHRADLWRTEAGNRLLQAPAFGTKTGMPRRRFDDIWSSLTFSMQDERGDNEGSAAHRWRLVSEFVDSINSHRAAHFSPSDLVCVDESISRWYGQGGHWIERGLPHYVAIDRKPENGCEIQNAACGRSGIMMQLQVVTTAEHEATRASEAEAGLKHGTVVLDRLVRPWYGKGDRIVCADSYFASVEAALHLQARRIRFIGVVKTATSSYPMKLLQSKVLSSRGEWRSYVHRRDGKIVAMAVVWVDRERRYFISTASSVIEGATYERTRWRQLDDGAQRVTLEVKQPRVAELYFTSCAMIDRHNRCRQDDLMLERKYQTQDWSVRINHSLLGMVIVDSWLLYAGARGPLRSMKQRTFYETLALELIDNDFNSVGLRARTGVSVPDQLTPTSGIGPHATPTKRRKRDKEGKEQASRAQRNCVICGGRTTKVCSSCREEGRNEVFICDSSKGRVCFSSHVRAEHG
jgi:hypothetical protein